VSAAPSSPWFAAALAAGLATGLLLLALHPEDRVSVRNTLLLLGVAALVALGATIAPPSGAARHAAEAAVLLAGLVLLRLALVFAFRIVLARAGLAPGRIVEDLTGAAAYLLWTFAWLRLAGVELASLVTTSALITAVVAFAMQDTLGNVLGGVLLQLESSIRVGEWLRVDDLSGRVTEVRWRHTTLQTPNGERIVLPNAWLLKNRFTVLGANDSTAASRRWVRLPVDLSASPGEVCRVLRDAVVNSEIDNVEAEPAADVVVLEIAARHAVYAIRYWLRDPWHADGTDSAVRVHALAALERNGMKLGAPYEEQLGLRDDEHHRLAQQAADLERRALALARVDLFRGLSEAERTKLAPHLRHAPFVAGDVMTRQGAVAHWLYLVVSGEADVWVDTEGGRTRVGGLRAGDVFGEMGMLTGAPRAATVIARADTVCYRLDKEGFESILHARPDIAEGISRVLAGRRTQLEDGLAAARAQEGPMRQQDILDSVRRFFGLGSGRAPSRETAASGTG
jgi:small-conductance mechanosensitive channel/CRP-like cAMP-binding protein